MPPVPAAFLLRRMAKDVIISTEALNCYGSRVLTAGIDTAQYERNPVLLWMHRRSMEGDTMPIGRIENLRKEDGRLIGTPVFDREDEFARKIESKWEQGFLKMASPSLEPTETSADPLLLLEGQTRETVTRCKLIEVSIVDIGGNDEALQLKGEPCQPLMLSARKEEADSVPLLNLRKEEKNNKPDNEHKKRMDKELLELLGLSEGAETAAAVSAVKLLKEQAAQAQRLQLAAMTEMVDRAVSERKILAADKEHYLNLGKQAGEKMLADTLALMKPQQKPTDTINLSAQSAPGAAKEEKKEAMKLSDLGQKERLELRQKDAAKYAELYEAEYGVKCPLLSE